MEPVERDRLVTALRRRLLFIWVGCAVVCPVGYWLLVHFVESPAGGASFEENRHFMVPALAVLAIIEGLAGVLIPRIGWVRDMAARRSYETTGDEAAALQARVTTPFIVGIALLDAVMICGILLYFLGGPQDLALKFIIPGAAAAVFMGTYMPALVDEYERSITGEERYPGDAAI